MKNILTVGAALMLTTTAVSAAGIDRSGQSIGAIFEDGKYVELSYGMVTPDVTGIFTVPAGPATGFEIGSGNAAPSYGTVGLAFKTDIDDKVSLALIIDQPFGADVAYLNTEPGYPISGTHAQVKTTAITAVGRYKFSDNLSVHFGPRYLTASGEYTRSVPSEPAGYPVQYSAEYASGSGTGYVAGIAYERKDIALRVALTYSSAIDLKLKTTSNSPFSGGDLTTTMPESINLDFQSGVAANTLVFGSVRWAAWDGKNIFDQDPAVGELVAWDEDTVTYTLGVGRKFSDSFSGALSVGYEAAQGGTSSNLSPTDGYTSVSVGGTFAMGNGVELTGGVRYIMAGDTTTDSIGAEFADNSAVAVGLKVAYTF